MIKIDFFGILCALIKKRGNETAKPEFDTIELLSNFKQYNYLHT